MQQKERIDEIVVPFPANDDDIDTIIEHLREKSRRGELAGIAVAAIGVDNHVFDTHAGYMGYRNIIMNGLLESLKLKINSVQR